MKSFIQFNETNLPDSPHLILGKLGLNPQAVPAGSDRSRIDLVRKAMYNRIHPYSGKIKPNKLGKPKS